MINLIKNEFVKLKLSKVIVSTIILVIIMYLIFYLNKDKDFNYLKNTVFSLIPFISIIVSIAFGGIVSNEFQNGTIRIYLTKPIRRWKVLFSKLIVIFINIIYYMIVVIISYLILLKVYKNGLINFNYVKDIAINFMPVYFVGVLTLFLSVITCNTAVSVGLSILTCFVSNIIAQIFFGLGYTIVQYTYLPYVDFSIFQDYEYISLMKSELGVNLSIKYGVIILIINIIFLLFLSFNIFTKKDIKN